MAAGDGLDSVDVKKMEKLFLGLAYRSRATLPTPRPPTTQENHMTATSSTTDDDTATSPHGKAVLDELSPLHRQLRRAIPDTYKGFGELHRAAFADGALDIATKELIALAIAVVEGCDGCIASHAQAAATRRRHPAAGRRGDRRHLPHARRTGHHPRPPRLRRVLRVRGRRLIPPSRILG